MTTRTIENKQDKSMLYTLIDRMDLPITVNVKKGKHRSTEQNRLQRLWVNEAAEQLLDESAEDKRAYCKLHFGVPILINENEDFAAQYNKTIRPLSYEIKLEIMKAPIDFPVTRLMTTKQKTEYLDEMYQLFKGQGVMLTEPKSEH